MEISSGSTEAQANLHRLFLSLAIVKSRPANMQLTEHLSRFRESVFLEVRGRDRVVQSHVKEAAYWKSKYLESQQLIESLKEKLDASGSNIADRGINLAIDLPVSNPVNHIKAREHRSNDQTHSPPPLESQIQESQLVNVLQDEEQIQGILSELNLKVPASNASNYMNHVYVLYRELSQAQPKGGTLNQCVIQLSMDFCGIVGRVSQEGSDMNAQRCSSQLQCDTNHDTDAEENTLSELHLTKRTLCHIIQACAQLANEKDDYGWDQTVFHVTLMFQSLLNAISTVAAREIELNDNGGRITSICTELSSVVLLMMFNLLSHGQILNDIINGCLHILFTKMGNLLRVCIGHASATSGNGGTASRKIYGGEARSMVCILDRILAQIRQPSGQAHQHQPSTTMLHKRLQDTILQAVFTNEKTAFALQLHPVPDPCSEQISLPKDLFSDCGLWFESEIWRLLYREVSEREM